MRLNDTDTPDLNKLRNDLLSHYTAKITLAEPHPAGEVMDRYAKSNPGHNAFQLKAAQYEILAENLQIYTYDDSPFYFVNDSSRGTLKAGAPFYSAGGWLWRRNSHLCRDADPKDYDKYIGMKAANLYSGSNTYFDVYHYCFPVANVVGKGLRYYYEKAEASLKDCRSEEERDFLQCAMAGLKAAKHMSERFSQAALERLPSLTDLRQRKFMEMIADTARRVPWEPPGHFYEALNTMWFCRDLMGELDGVSSSHLGRADLILHDLYQNDIESGYMTHDEAYDLVCRFLVHGDCQYDKDSIAKAFSDHELEMGIVLGGYDRDGNDVFNDITRMFIRAHRALGLIFPKLHFRFNQYSCDEYLDDICEDFVNGRSIANLINDDSIIPVLVDAGKSTADARCYVNTGCWGIVVEGMENSARGNYFHLLSALERTIYGDNDICREIGVHFNPIDDAESFEEVYQIFYDNMIYVLRERQRLVREHAPLGVKVNPIPMFSVCVDGCIESRRDVLAGGSKYTVNEFALSEMANTVDGLLAIKTLCFDKKLIGLREFLDAVRSNWMGHEMLRLQLKQCPHYGDESSDSYGLTKRLFDDIYRDTRDLLNEFGTPFMVDLFIFQELRFVAEKIRATPDGRFDGDVVAHAANPTRFHADPLPAVLNSITAIDFQKAQSHQITIQLPAGKMDARQISSLIRAMGKLNMKNIQINCVDANVLLDARKNPERHQDLVVRVLGFSSKFVALSPEWQDEFINRVVYSA